MVSKCEGRREHGIGGRDGHHEFLGSEVDVEWGGLRLRHRYRVRASHSSDKQSDEPRNTHLSLIDFGVGVTSSTPEPLVCAGWDRRRLLWWQSMSADQEGRQ